MLRPTPELLAEVEGEPALLAGFDDAEVMAAVAEIAADARLFEKHRHNVKASWRRVHRMHGCSRTRVTSTQERHARVCPSRWWTFTSAWVAWWRPGAEMRETSKQQCQCGARCQS